jgi:hypothetical protein
MSASNENFLPSTRARRVGLALGIIAGCGVLLLVWLIWNASRPELPLYPHAQEVEILPRFEGATNDGQFKATLYTISFWTSDPPVDVLAYYDATLPQQGWQLQTITPEQVHIYTRESSSEAQRQGLTVWAGRSERPKLYHVGLSMGNYDEMHRIHAL